MQRYVPPVLALALVIGLGATARAGPTKQEGSPQANYVGSETCLDCHDTEWESFRKSVHYQTETGDYAARGCESCHGPGSVHVESEGEALVMFSYTNGEHTAQEKADQCLSCHSGRESTYTFSASEHMKGGVDCSTCHKPHQAATDDFLLAESGHEFCLSCHEEIRTAVNLNERHRILEGMVQCTDCHDQHAPSQRMQLGGVKHEKCFECHTDKEGPFVYEHASERVEGCTACHSPHGFTARHVLSNQSNAELCFQCHAVVPGFHNPGVRFDSTSLCTNCHSAIHGSNINEYFLR